MIATVRSSQLQQAVRSINQMNSEEKQKLFQNQAWFQNLLLSEAEGNTVQKVFSQNSSIFVRRASVSGQWG